MKPIYIFIAFVLFVMTACKDEKKNTDEEQNRIFQVERVNEHTELQQMQVSRIQQDITCKGKKYHLSVTREPNKNLPQVKSDMGLFLDNQISVKILRENSTVLFEKAFTKNDFKSYLSAEYLLRSVLEGIVFDDEKTREKNVLALVASVSYPMTDLYTPFTIVISDAGKMSLMPYEEKIEFTPLDESKE